MLTERPRWVLLLGVAFALRLPAVFDPPRPISDAADYQRLAVGLRTGRGYVDSSGKPTAFRPPLYPALLACLRPDDPRTSVATGVVLGTAAAGLTVRLAQLAVGGGLGPWIGGLLVAVDPVHRALSGRLLSENLYEPLLLLALAVLLGGARRSAALSGAIFGLCCLTRSAAVPLALGLGVWLWWWRDRRAAAAFLLSGALVASPWLVRNWVSLGAPVLSTQGGVTLYSSYRPPEGRVFGVVVRDEVVEEAAGHGEVDADRILTRAAWALAIRHPLETLRLMVLKLAFLWVPVDWEVLTPPGRLAVVFLFSLPLALAAFVKRPDLFRVFLLVLGVVCAFSAIVYGSPRLRLPYEPLVFIAAGWLVCRIPTVSLILWGLTCGGLALAGVWAKDAIRWMAGLVGLW
jgi:hypothetical protein